MVADDGFLDEVPGFASATEATTWLHAMATVLQDVVVIVVAVVAVDALVPLEGDAGHLRDAVLTTFIHTRRPPA